ncbi:MULTISPECIES: hypothetical protein [Streptomyces]|uniref:hypothetical protein n=1 Tax=Streptomyces TaxID=1883 RepID=UPI00364DEE0A
MDNYTVEWSLEGLRKGRFVLPVPADCGRPIVFEQLPIARVEAFSTDLAAMFRYFTEVGLDIDVNALRRDFPEIGWQRFATWAAERTWPVD